MKKVVFFVLIFVLFPFEVDAQGEGRFPDVLSYHPNFTAIEYLAAQGIINGYPDSSFRPYQIINRAEAVKIAVSASGETPHPEVFNNCFIDVTTQWFASYVCFAKGKLWVKGYPGTTNFAPYKSVNVAETIRITINAFALPIFEATNFLKIKWDVPRGYKQNPLGKSPREWWENYLVTARQYQLLDHTPFPQQEMTRGEFAEMVYRAVLRKQKRK